VRRVHRQSARLLSWVMALIGLAVVARTLSAGGGPVSIGLIFGVMLLALGLGRLALAGDLRRPSSR
jgi:hypothetical protein